MYILAIDTSNTPMSVAVVTEQQTIGEITLNRQATHSQTLMPAIAQLLQLTGLKIEAIDRFVVAQGPGSYTGIRIGVTTAKTLAWTLHKELVGISSLKVLASNILQTPKFLVPLMDARRNNVFAGIYQWQLTGQNQLLNVLGDQHIALATLLTQIKALRQPVVFIGEVNTFKSQIFETLGDQAEFTTGFNNLPHAANLGQLGVEAPLVQNIHAFTPRYLRRTEAETNWLKTHHNEGHEPYVQEV